MTGKYLQSWEEDDFQYVFLYPAKLPFKYEDIFRQKTSENFTHILSTITNKTKAIQMKMRRSRISGKLRNYKKSPNKHVL